MVNNISLKHLLMPHPIDVELRALPGLKRMDLNRKSYAADRNLADLVEALATHSQGDPFLLSSGKVSLDFNDLLSIDSDFHGHRSLVAKADTS